MVFNNFVINALKKLRAVGTSVIIQHSDFYEFFCCILFKFSFRSAQLAQRMSAQLFQTLYFKDLPLSDPRQVFVKGLWEGSWILKMSKE